MTDKPIPLAWYSVVTPQFYRAIQLPYAVEDFEPHHYQLLFHLMRQATICRTSVLITADEPSDPF